MARDFTELKPQRTQPRRPLPEEEQPKPKKAKAEVEETVEIGEPICENISYLTEVDYHEFTKAMIEKRVKFRVTLWSIVAVLFGAVLFYRDIMGIDKGVLNFVISIVLMIAGGLFALYFNIIMPQKTARQYASEDYNVSPDKKPYKRFRFFAERLKSNTDAGKSNDIRYERVHHIKETQNLLILAINEQHAYLMRKDSFVKGTFEEAKALIEAGIERRKEKERQERIQQLEKAKQERHSVKRGPKLFGKKDDK